MIVLEEMGNLFLEESQDLLVIDTRVVMGAAVADSVRKVELLGEAQYKNYFGRESRILFKTYHRNIDQRLTVSVQFTTDKDEFEEETPICCT